MQAYCRVFEFQKENTIETARGLPRGPGKKLYFFAITDEEEFQEVIFFPGSFFVTFFAAKKSKNILYF
jgi:hypothetical protein